MTGSILWEKVVNYKGKNVDNKVCGVWVWTYYKTYNKELNLRNKMCIIINIDGLYR